MPIFETEITDRGFELIRPLSYGEHPERCRLVQQSSAVGEYADSYDRPGTSFLWFGEDHHLDREQVAELRDRLSRWLDAGSLLLDGEQGVPIHSELPQ